MSTATMTVSMPGSRLFALLHMSHHVLAAGKETVLNQRTGCKPLYWKRTPTPWYDVIGVERILCMEPVVPDFYHDGEVPSRKVSKFAPMGKPGDPLVVRNVLARRFGRSAPRLGARMHT